MVQIGDPWADVPQPGPYWAAEDSAWRAARVQEVLALVGFEGSVVAATQHGLVVLDIAKEMAPNERGTYLMDIEMELKRCCDPSILVELRPRVDLNALRNLRGVEVKQWRQE